MDAFISFKRCRTNPPANAETKSCDSLKTSTNDEEPDSTDLKIATLASLFPDLNQEALLDLLIAADGSVDEVVHILYQPRVPISPRKRSAAGAGSIGCQASLDSFRTTDSSSKAPATTSKPLTRKGATLHLYTPEDIAAHTPCSIIHNFLPAQQADALLRELLEEAPTFGRQSFKLFDNVVQSPHTACFYVDSFEEQTEQKTEYVYNGSYLEDVRQITAQMRAISPKVQFAVNDEVAKRIKHHYPEGKKLRYQSPGLWTPNAAFVNCYKGGAESVGYHTDQLTYLGPRAVIGSISLGVAREFRVRKIVAREVDTDEEKKGSQRADAEGQIAIHLPHNSLLVMHAEMQEEWKHSIHPATVIDPHPIAGNKRINITYRHYRESFHPKYTPRCRCGVATVLRCVLKKKENRGRYMWMCHAGYTPGQQGCSFFQWAEFDEDGQPPWAKEPDT